MTITGIIEIILLIFLVILLLRISFTSASIPPEYKKALKEKRIPSTINNILRFQPDKLRMFNFWFQIERIEKEQIPGDFAELGVYKGKTARIIHLLAPERKLHLFDTFAGFPANDLNGETGEAATYTPKNFADCSLEGVREYIKGNDNIVFHKGYFPETTADLQNKKYAFVNMDADLYKPTIAGLAYFYPRLSPGGVIIIHDYNHKWPGLMKAVDEFAETIPEVFVSLADKDSSLMIVKNWERG